mgnify:FL=1
MDPTTVSRVLMAVIGLVHLIPVTGMLGTQRLTALYGIEVPEGDIVLLLQHRALGFALVAIVCFTSALNSTWLGPARLIATLSMVSFVALVVWQQPANTALVKVAIIDGVLLILLGLSVVWSWVKN